MDPSAAAAEQGVNQSGPSPVQAPEFRAEEAPSFDRRLTPVVASWPEQEASRVRTEPPAHDPPAETGPSISKRPTHGPAAETVNAARAEPPPEPTPTTPRPASTRPAQDLTAPQASQRSISISLTPSGDEHAFWDGDPQYSVAPPRLVSEPPPPRPSRTRTASARLLFVTIAGVAVGLLYYEAAIAYHVPWQNPKLLVERIRRG
jgi:hypothetical protein